MSILETWGISEWGSFATCVATLWIIGTTLYVRTQVKLQQSGADTDRKRFLKESIVILHDSLHALEFKAARERFFAVHEKPYQLITEDERSNAHFILSQCGMTARLIENGAIDFNFFVEYWKSTLERDWIRLINFVREERVNSRNEKLFVSTEKLVTRMKQAL